MRRRYRCLGLRSLPETAGDVARATPRARIDAFIERVRLCTGRRIARADIWRVAGYKDATQFERFQRARRVSLASAANFTRVLQMEPADFLRRMESLRQ